MLNAFIWLKPPLRSSIMHSIEQQALQTYQENILYFQKNHPQIHTKLIALDTAISEGLYVEK